MNTASDSILLNFVSCIDDLSTFLNKNVNTLFFKIFAMSWLLLKTAHVQNAQKLMSDEVQANRLKQFWTCGNDFNSYNKTNSKILVSIRSATTHQC